MSVPFMRSTLGPNARLEVSIAWGADLAANPATWTWTEITTDIFAESKISITVGRGDEAAASQPASCSFTVDNRTAAYSKGGQSPNWPNVRRGTPIRVRVDPDGSGLVTRFHGEAIGFTPTFDSTGIDARVQISASGSLRRLQQGKPGSTSPFRKATLADPDIVAYWPCEEEQKATVFGSAFDGHPPMTISGDAEHPLPDFADSKDFIASKPLPMVRQTAWRGSVPPYSGSGQMQVSMLMSFPEDSINGTECVLCSVFTTGSLARTDLIYGVGGLVAIRAYDTTGTLVANTALTSFGADNTIRFWAISAFEQAGDVFLQVGALGVGWEDSGFAFVTAAGFTLGIVDAVAIGPNKDVGDLILGHVAVRGTFEDEVNWPDRLNGQAGERATIRLSRLCSENDLPLELVGTSDVFMGAQNVTTLVKSLRECETADGGVLYDGFSSGLRYISRPTIENGAAVLTLNAANGDPARDVAAVDDDQRTVNKVTAERDSGLEAVFEDVDGPMGTAAIGIYDDNIKVNIFADAHVIDYASRAVGRGTIEGYRFPKLQLDLAAKPALAPAWCDATLGSRIDVTNLSTVRPALPAGTLSLIVEGYTETIDQFTWDVKINASPFDIWRAGQLVADSSDTNPFPLRATSDGSTLNSSALLGATSLSVATPSGPLWTTTAAEMPIIITVGGVIVTVTAISGASSPQTFTVNATTKALGSGLDVELYQPTTPTLGNGQASLPYAVGDTVSAAVLRAEIPQIAVLPGSRTLSQVVTQTEATGLAVQLQPLARYAIEGFVSYESGTTPDIVFGLVAPQAVRGHWIITALNNGVSGSPGPLRMNLNDTFVGVNGVQAFGGALDNLSCELRGYVVTGYEGGPLRLSFCQFTSDASQTAVYAGSWLRVTRIL